jgi:glycine cleavage system H protein
MTPTPRDRKYTPDAKWVRMDGDVAVMGICYVLLGNSWSGLGDIVVVNFPEVGERFARLEDVGFLQGVGTNLSIHAPLSGEVLECNEQLRENPGLLNKDYYGAGWFIKMRPSDPAELDELMTAEQFDVYLETHRFFA